MTDTEFAAWMRTLPREVSPQEVERREHLHDAERGMYVPHGETVHHSPDESRH